MAHIEYNTTYLVITMGEITTTISLPNKASNMSQQLINAKYPSSEVARIITEGTSEELAEYRAYCAECNNIIAELDLETLNEEATKAREEEEERTRPEREFQAAKSAKLSAINAYDTSSAVNEFTYQGTPMWLSKADRVGLMNSTTILKNGGEESTTLWFGSLKLTLSCDDVISMLSALEVYALECYDVTAQHKANVSAMTTKEAIEAYNYEQGYPQKLAF